MRFVVALLCLVSIVVAQAAPVPEPVASADPDAAHLCPGCVAY